MPDTKVYCTSEAGATKDHVAPVSPTTWIEELRDARCVAAKPTGLGFDCAIGGIVCDTRSRPLR